MCECFLILVYFKTLVEHKLLIKFSLSFPNMHLQNCKIPDNDKNVHLLLLRDILEKITKQSGVFYIQKHIFISWKTDFVFNGDLLCTNKYSNQQHGNRFWIHFVAFTSLNKSKNSISLHKLHPILSKHLVSGGNASN